MIPSYASRGFQCTLILLPTASCSKPGRGFFSLGGVTIGRESFFFGGETILMSSSLSNSILGVSLTASGSNSSLHRLPSGEAKLGPELIAATLIPNTTTTFLYAGPVPWRIKVGAWGDWFTLIVNDLKVSGPNQHRPRGRSEEEKGSNALLAPTRSSHSKYFALEPSSEVPAHLKITS